jgi:hypothetical protein
MRSENNRRQVWVGLPDVTKELNPRQPFAEIHVNERGVETKLTDPI